MRSSVCFTTALLFISWYSTLDSIVLMRPGTGEPTWSSNTACLLSIAISNFHDRFHHPNFFGELFEARRHFVKADPIGNPGLGINLIFFKHADNRWELSATVPARINRDFAPM